MTVELVGDRWSLLVLRDIMFAGRHTFADLHGGSAEGIATNILTDRRKRLVSAGVLTRRQLSQGRRKVRYDLTERGIELLPVLVAIGGWGADHLPADPQLAQTVRDLQAGGQAAQESLMDRLREANLEVGDDATGSNGRGVATVPSSR